MPSGSIATLSQILQARPRQISGETVFSDISTDTRRLSAGSIFVALQGETFDGHAFIPLALDRGAVAVITEQPIAGPHLQVPDTLQAYQQIARWWRDRFQIPIIAITGSAGKTTTKELLAKALERYGKVLKSPANHNNDIGVPHTLLQIKPEHEFVVLELAMRGAGEIARLAQMAQPTQALILNIGTAHIGRLGSRAAIAQAKCELLSACPQTLAILNGEDDLLLETAQSLTVHPPLTFGLDRGQIRGHWYPHTQQIQMGEHLLPIPLPGRHHALNWMAVLGTIHSLGLPLDPLTSPLVFEDELIGRHQCYHLSPDLQILDQTYNAAPEAMIAALQLLSQMPGHRRWAILGPMRELGEYAPALYAQVGEAAASLAIDQLWVLDPEDEMQPLLHPLAPGQGQCFRSPQALLSQLIQQIGPGDRILFKAARAMHLETLMQDFIHHWQQSHPQ